ncbi:MAG TPA: hypothetical protein VM052_04225 [Candidatus Limnocylindrales bacterium]|nr:hypothetical protein [Candidatus Limnocylindrales bacterium]
MEPYRTGRRYVTVEQPLSPRDYDVPVGWWGWNWEPPVPMSITEILAAGNMDARTAALCGLVLEAHGSLLISAEEPHSGKTTTLTALLDYLPQRTRRIFIRGWSETFDYLEQTAPLETILLANELSSHLPVYLWGPKAVRVFSTLGRGYALGSTLHADNAREAVTQLTGELGVPAVDLARVELLMVMRIYGSSRGGAERRVVSLDRLGLQAGAVELTPLVTHDIETDAFTHHREAELALLAEVRGEDASASAGVLDRTIARLDGLLADGTFDIPEVRAAIAADRGEKAQRVLRGDPVNG